MADNGDFNMSQRPLAGVVMCCTSIAPEKRSDIAASALQMGAIHKLDLTSDVTHLIVGDTDTPKYKYVAKERPDVKCLLPEWVDAVCRSWMEGGETDVEALEIQFKLPTFSGLKVCVTGFEDLVLRKKLEDTVKNNGGEYRGDLTKEVTHLIAHKPAGNKYIFAKQWGIRVVSIEWLQQSLERGMILDENLFDPLIVPSERGHDAWVRKTVSTSSLLKRPREDELITGPARKLRRTVSARYSNENDGIWTDIVGGRVGLENVKQDQWDDTQHEKTNLGVSILNKSILRNSRGSVSAEQEPEAESSPVFVLPHEDSRKERSPANHGFFHDKRFYIYGFDSQKSIILENHLRSHDAEILAELSQVSCKDAPAAENTLFLLVPHTSSEHDIPSIAYPSPTVTVVTDMWIERCLHRKCYVQPEANVTNSLFQYPLPGFETMVICCTAFEGIDLLQVSKVIKLTGAKYDEYLTESISVLVCNDSSLTREKVRHAIEWEVPAVKADWLWDSLRAGRRKSFDSYLIYSNEQIEKDHIVTRDSTGPVPQIEDGRDRSQRAVRNQSNESKTTTKRDKFALNTELNITQGAIPTSESCHAPSAASSPGPYDKGDSDTPQPVAASSRRASLVANVSVEVQTKVMPLQELSPNSPAKNNPVPEKQSRSEPMFKPDNQPDPITTALSSLLAHHQRGSSKAPQTLPTESIRLGRRRRQLLGRAPSNVSAHSNGSFGASRASSVDTVNTDGIGTPLETTYPASSKSDAKIALTASLLADFREDEPESAEPASQLTQLGYEDAEAKAWRDRLLSRMGERKQGTSGNETSPKAKGIGTIQDIAGVGAQSVSKRTRHAGTR